MPHYFSCIVNLLLLFGFWPADRPLFLETTLVINRCWTSHCNKKRKVWIFKVKLTKKFFDCNNFLLSRPARPVSIVFKVCHTVFYCRFVNFTKCSFTHQFKKFCSDWRNFTTVQNLDVLCSPKMVKNNRLKLSLSTTATLGTVESGLCRQVAVVERFKQETI